ncbi:hypothetical protein PS947_06011 [Pseudomonas fluorescens]|nr:hypothetical protein PS947_06011 [Pseudomonas fluorescens]
MAILPTCLPGMPASPVNAPRMSPGRSLSLRPAPMHKVLIGGSSGSPPLFFTLSCCSQRHGLFCRASIACARWPSAGATRLTAMPFSPARPVRPTRCTWISASRASSTLMTRSRASMSRPRAATSVATSTELLRMANRVRTSSRSRCSRSPCRASATIPLDLGCWTTSSHCCLVKQKVTQDCGR